MIIAFARQGQEIGHFAEDEVPALVASGQILPSDDYWHEGLDDWRKVGDRWPVAEVAHHPTTPVMTMEDVPTSSRSTLLLYIRPDVWAARSPMASLVSAKALNDIPLVARG